MSFGELCVLVIVAIVIIGPKDLPKVLRKAGNLAGKIRRMASDVRAESGIDDVLRSEGLHKEIAEIRRLAQGDFHSPSLRSEKLVADRPPSGLVVAPEREYPSTGPDSHGALPDGPHAVTPYDRATHKSPFAVDPLYVTGDASGVLPVSDPLKSSDKPPHGASLTEGASPPVGTPREAGHA